MEGQVDWTFYLSNFLRTQNGKAYKTIKAYEGGIKAFLYYLEEKEIDKPLPDDVHDYLGYLREQRKSVFTIGLYMISLKLFFAYLASIHFYPDIYNEASPKMKRPQKGIYHREIPTDEEIILLRKTVPRDGQLGERDLLMVDLSLYCGLSVNEIANISIVDLAMESNKTKLYIIPRGETQKNNFVWVDPALSRRLAAYAEKYKLEKYIFTDISHRGSKGHLCSSTISTIIGRYMKKAKIKRKNLTANSLVLYYRKQHAHNHSSIIKRRST